jgi:DNA-directed RNA polymerase subunit RPC12/RpoP
MARPFDFSDKVKWEAMLRQKYRCGHCGGDLRKILDNAHHVVPNQAGGASNPAHQWLKSTINCIYLCDDCHVEVHEDGKFRTGAVWAADHYRYSHGGDHGAHRKWVKELDKLARTVWLEFALMQGRDSGRDR